MVQFKPTIKQFGEQGEKTGWSYITIPADISEKLKPGIKKSFRVKGNARFVSDSRQALIADGKRHIYFTTESSIRKAIHKNKGATVETCFGRR